MSDGRLMGTVKWFDFNRGFGFIEPATGGKDVFVHVTAVQKSGLERLNDGQKVTFSLQERRGKKQAGQIEVVE